MVIKHDFVVIKHSIWPSKIIKPCGMVRTVINCVCLLKRTSYYFIQPFPPTLLERLNWLQYVWIEFFSLWVSPQLSFPLSPHGVAASIVIALCLHFVSSHLFHFLPLGFMFLLLHIIVAGHSLSTTCHTVSYSHLPLPVFVT